MGCRGLACGRLGAGAVISTEGHPVVYGEWLHAAPSVPTDLFDGHYDVQPALDLDSWESPPFEPHVRGENLVRTRRLGP